MTQSNNYKDQPVVHNETTTVVTPIDRVRWGPILAGLFAAMSALTLLSVLGLAIGLSAWDPGDNARNWSIGAGIWSIISALIAFFIGGMLAARSAAAAGSKNGTLNGAMVWAVAIPLLLFLLGGGFASMAQTAVQGTQNSRVVYMNQNSANTSNTLDRAQTASAQITGNSADGSSANVASNGNANRANLSNDAANDAARGAWWTLVSLVLGLIAAAIGGAVGARRPDVLESNYSTTAAV
jgi:hypothetical protein